MKTNFDLGTDIRTLITGTDELGILQITMAVGFDDAANKIMLFGDFSGEPIKCTKDVCEGDCNCPECYKPMELLKFIPEYQCPKNQKPIGPLNLKTCVYCLGKGLLELREGSGSVTCTGCEGSGKVEVKTEDLKCTVCSGAGIIGHATWFGAFKCHSCQGTGSIVVEPEKCLKCSGTGVISPCGFGPLTCPDCKEKDLGKQN